MNGVRSDTDSFVPRQRALPSQPPDAVIDLTTSTPRRIVAGWRPLRIAMVGQKGVPATYGGIERHVEEIAARLVEYGHDVHVFCRDSYGDYDGDVYRGIKVHRVGTVGTKHFDAIAHSANSTIAALRLSPDVVHYHALGPGLVAPLPKYLSRSKVVLTVHGLDHERAKWGLAGRLALGRAHWMSARVPDRTVVVSRALGDHYDRTFNRATTCITNGVEPAEPQPARLIRGRYGLERGSYLLSVGRLVPEKAPDLLIRAFRRLGGPWKLAIVGDSSFTDGYVAELKALAADDPRIIFTGYAYGDVLNELYSNAAAFVIPSYVEGLPLTLLEAASYGTPLIASDIAPHVEVLGADQDGRRLFAAGNEDDLLRALQHSLANAAVEEAAAVSFREEVLRDYNWHAAATQLERVYLDLDSRSGHPRTGDAATVTTMPLVDHAPTDNSMAKTTTGEAAAMFDDLVTSTSTGQSGYLTRYSEQ